METAESKYVSILDNNDSLVDYVDMIEDILERRESILRMRNELPDTLTTALEFDLIQVKGLRQSGHTLAILEMAKEGDLVFLPNIGLGHSYMTNDLRNHDALVVVPEYSAFGELRSKPDVIRKRREHGELQINLPEGFKPNRIFVDDASHVFKENYDARSLIRWARARFEVSPIIIGLG